MVKVWINNPMCGVYYDFDSNKDEFMKRFNNQINAVGYFVEDDIKGNTLIINPSNCSFIEIVEEKGPQPLVITKHES